MFGLDKLFDLNHDGKLDAFEQDAAQQSRVHHIQFIQFSVFSSLEGEFKCCCVEGIIGYPGIDKPLGRIFIFAS